MGSNISTVPTNVNCLSLPSFEFINYSQDMRLLFKYIHGSLPADVISYKVPQANTTKTDLIYIQKHRVAKTMNSFLSRASKSFNDLYSTSFVLV